MPSRRDIPRSHRSGSARPGRRAILRFPESGPRRRFVRALRRTLPACCSNKTRAARVRWGNGRIRGAACRRRARGGWRWNWIFRTYSSSSAPAIALRKSQARVAPASREQNQRSADRHSDDDGLRAKQRHPLEQPGQAGIRGRVNRGAHSFVELHGCPDGHFRRQPKQAHKGGSSCGEGGPFESAAPHAPVIGTPWLRSGPRSKLISQ